MEKKFLSRQYLESMSTADLISLADDYGIDIPDNLNRRFIIGELLEIAEELEQEKNQDEDVLLTEEPDDEKIAELPKTYNDTKIYAMLRNPAWVYVFWDIKESEVRKINTEKASISLRAFFFSDKYTEKPEESFDIQLTAEDRERTFLLPAGKKFFTVSLVYSSSKESPSPLATTQRIEIPQESEQIKNTQPGKNFEMSPLVRLSGMQGLLHDHYVNHRQSFSI